MWSPEKVWFEIRVAGWLARIAFFRLLLPLLASLLAWVVFVCIPLYYTIQYVHGLFHP